MNPAAGCAEEELDTTSLITEAAYVASSDVLNTWRALRPEQQDAALKPPTKGETGQHLLDFRDGRLAAMGRAGLADHGFRRSAVPGHPRVPEPRLPAFGDLRHQAGGIRRPEDLAGKTAGELALYGHDAGVMPKGTLSDEHGVAPGQCRWIVGGIDFPMRPIDYVPQPHPGDVEVSWADAHADLGKMLEAGEIDALVSADTSECVLRKSPKLAACSRITSATDARPACLPLLGLAVVEWPRSGRPGAARTGTELHALGVQSGSANT